ncbi:hypothetical protein [Mastigocoleus sp. MO_188.B34]|uniref:hypothetical protein n=1 Tax=Mastigocoleus sp. MO_188.B34 TaxID=3036635 RepID=UPI00262A5570|nr:hypothetical protein [Mastigocoleus sp. MO_188.B34]MDJ0694016.1 hypothetical protein [Mastigocoleus sp. MO_188.B34]
MQILSLLYESHFKQYLTKAQYQNCMGIEAMFKDCKTGGYNLEVSKAINRRLKNLVLLIAIAYTMSALKGKLIKHLGFQKYI